MEEKGANELNSKSKYEQICHPLLLDLVLETMFGHLSEDTLGACRLVCRQWNDMSTPYFKQKNLSTVIILQDEDSLMAFISTFVPSRSPPWTNFQLNNFFELSLFDRQLFFDICSESIKSLKISPGYSVDLVTLFSMLSQSLPCLEKLELDGLRSLITNQLSQSVSSYLNFELARNRVTEFLKWHFELTSNKGDCESPLQFGQLRHLKIVIQMEEDTSDTSFSFFKVLLSLTPKLTSFACSCLDITAENTTIPGVIQALANHPSILAQLTSLRIDDLSNDCMDTLIRFKSLYGLKLTKLFLMAPMQDVQPSTIENLLKSQADTLEELSIGGHYCRMGAALQIKKLTWPFSMPRLKRLNFMGGLTIGSNFEYINPIPWHHLQYSQQLPCIQTLGLFYLTSHAMDSVWPDDPQHSLRQSPCLTLKKIDFSGGVEPIQTRKLAILAQSFPAVEDFSATISTADSLLALFETWPKLQVLNIRLASMIPNLDTHFTGIQLDMNKIVEEEEDELSRSMMLSSDAAHHGADTFESLESVDGSRKSVNILLLQDLKKLTINLECVHIFYASRSNNTALLSDITAMTALRHLKKLCHLVINRSVMTKNGLQILNEELTLEKCQVGDQFGKIINFHPILQGGGESEQIYYESSEGCTY